MHCSFSKYTRSGVSNPVPGGPQPCRCLVQIPTLAVFALEHLTTYMMYFLYLLMLSSPYNIKIFEFVVLLIK